MKRALLTVTTRLLFLISCFVCISVLPHSAGKWSSMADALNGTFDYSYKYFLVSGYVYAIQCLFCSLDRRLASFDVNLSTWTTLLDNVSYASYSVMAVNVQDNIIAMGNISGSLLLLFLETCSPASMY
jgi:hypothetical protein